MVVEAEAATQVGVEGLVFESLTDVLKSEFFSHLVNARYSRYVAVIGELK